MPDKGEIGTMLLRGPGHTASSNSTSVILRYQPIDIRVVFLDRNSHVRGVLPYILDVIDTMTFTAITQDVPSNVSF